MHTCTQTHTLGLDAEAVQRILPRVLWLLWSQDNGSTTDSLLFCCYPSSEERQKTTKWTKFSPLNQNNADNGQNPGKWWKGGEKKSTNSEEGKRGKEILGFTVRSQEGLEQIAAQSGERIKARVLKKELWGIQREELEVLMHNKVWDLPGVTETCWELTQLKY